MKRTLILLAVVIGFATSANAASLTLTSNKSTYNVGENIVLTLQGINNGESAVAVFARLQYDPTKTEFISRSESPHAIGMMNQATTGPDNAGDGFVHAIDQLIAAVPGGGTVNQGPPGTVATVTLLAENAGTVNVSYFVKSGDSLTLNYFGISNQAGISFLIVPEPTTAALVGLGLVGLVLGGRRRS